MCNLPIKLPIEKESFIVNIEKSLEKSTSEVILNPKIISIIPNIPFKKDLFEINSENILFYSFFSQNKVRANIFRTFIFLFNLTLTLIKFILL